MYSEVQANRVLYWNTPGPSHQFRQIAVVENEQFEVRIFTGSVVETDPKFIAISSGVEVYFHPNLQAALADVENKFQESIAAGWIPFPTNRD
jgi:hypothetical protein